MDFEDIIILIVAAIGWIYSNYRKLQKQAVERSRKLSVPEEIKPELPKPVVVRAKPVKSQSLEKAISSTEAVPANYDERKKAEEFWQKMQGETGEPSYINADVNKKNEYEPGSEQVTQYINVVDEIHSGNIDWKKAIIYSEILRPVYF
jgi:hypothetical protein